MRRHRGALLLAVLALAGGLFLAFVLVLGSMMGSTPEGSAPCGTDLAGPALPAGAAGVGGLSAAQLANADAVISEGRRRQVPVQAVVVALAVAAQESRFTVYANDGRGGDLAFFQLGVDASLSLPHEAVGTDHGSLGVFQQQWPWWGTMRDLMDPARSAGKFYDALLQVPGWEQMPVTVAAQTVQRSAYPDAYADDEALARELLGAAGTATATGAAAVPAGHTSGSSCSVAGDPGEVTFPLPPGTQYVDNRNWGRSGSHWARMHTGTDFSAACGTPVLAATAGRVVVRSDQPWSGRWLVQVSTGIGRLTTWYAHLQALSVAPGATVTAGQQIGEVGDLGNSTGCHLHFEVHPRGGSIYQDSVDPTAWLGENVGRDTGHAVPASWSSGSEAFTVATFNVLGDSHTRASGSKSSMPSGVARVPGVVRLLEKYGVDVVGLQELQRPQHRALRARAGSTYAVWSPRGDTENAVAWRRERWDLVAARTLSVPYFDGHRRRMPVVRLRDRTTGRESFFVNVHNPADTRRHPRQARWREVAVAREAALVRRLRASTGLPVFLTGDLNDRRAAYCRLTGTAGMLASNGGGTEGTCSPPRPAGIDWVLGAGAEFSDHTVDRSPAVRATSDHPFVVTRARVG